MATDRVRCDRRCCRNRGVGRVAVGRNLAIDTRNGVEELLLDGGEGGLGGIGKFGARQGEAADGGGYFQGARDLGQGHIVEILFAEALEEASGGGEEFLGGIPLLLPEVIEARGPIGGALATPGSLGLSLLLKETGVEGLHAVVPVKLAGPVFDRGEALTEFIGHRLMGAMVAELEEGHESAIGSRGFAGKTGKSQLGRVISRQWTITGLRG